MFRNTTFHVSLRGDNKYETCRMDSSSDFIACACLELMFYVTIRGCQTYHEFTPRPLETSMSRIMRFWSSYDVDNAIAGS